MFNLIKNELIKILKRKNIYILFIIAILVLLTYNIFKKISNINLDITTQYERAYKQDKLYLENYENMNFEEEYTDIFERTKLEKYAIENNIKYNILLNSENKNIPIKIDARIMLMRLFNNFDIIVIFIIIYISSTIISEECISGTIKNLLIKPHKRTIILISKIITAISIVLIIATFIIIFQYIIGGIIFGFDSYSLEAIRYNYITQDINTMDLSHYIILIFACKLPMYIVLTLISLLFGIITNNIAINILFSLGFYIISKIEILINNISKYLIIYNWDISKYLFGEMFNIPNVGIIQSILISVITILIIFVLLILIFRNKDIVNE